MMHGPEKPIVRSYAVFVGGDLLVDFSDPSDVHVGEVGELADKGELVVYCRRLFATVNRAARIALGSVNERIDVLESERASLWRLIETTTVDG